MKDLGNAKIRAGHALIIFQWDLEIPQGATVTTMQLKEKITTSKNGKAGAPENQPPGGGFLDVDINAADKKQFFRLAELKKPINGANYRLLHVDGPGFPNLIDPISTDLEKKFQFFYQLKDLGNSLIPDIISINIEKTGRITYEYGKNTAEVSPP